MKTETRNQNQKIKVGVIGARGYAGVELSRILLSHPEVEYRYYFYSQGRGFNFEELGFNTRMYKALPRGGNTEDLIKAHSSYLSELDVLFLATPNEVSLELIPYFKKQSIHLIDLSGAFRLNYKDKQQAFNQYLKYYKLNHNQVEMLDRFIFGLVPFNRNQFSRNQASQEPKPYWIANPGCYVTSVLMALKPLLLEGLLDPKGIVIDAKSGTSGAGKKAAENLIFSEIYNECLPYKISQHQHFPEIEMFLNQGLSEKVEFIFTPHLLPIHRGLISSIYTQWSVSFKLKSDLEKAQAVHQAYQKYYSDYPLIRWGRVNENKTILNMKYIVETPLTQIGYEIDEDHLYLFSQIDNLLKGAASQAIENLNLMYGLKPETGLT